MNVFHLRLHNLNLFSVKNSREKWFSSHARRTQISQDVWVSLAWILVYQWCVQITINQSESQTFLLYDSIKKASSLSSELLLPQTFISFITHSSVKGKPNFLKAIEISLTMEPVLNFLCSVVKYCLILACSSFYCSVLFAFLLSLSVMSSCCDVWLMCDAMYSVVK